MSYDGNSTAAVPGGCRAGVPPALPKAGKLVLIASRRNAGATNLQTLIADVMNQIPHAAGVSPFIVIPGDHLDAIAGDHQSHRRVDNRRARIAFEIRRNQLPFFDSEI